jgi:vanillate O-demethylase monooxygenase subunit
MVYRRLGYDAVVRSQPANNDSLFEGLRCFLMEDVEALGDIQQLFDSLPPEHAQVEISIASDNLAIRMRRIIETSTSAERAADKSPEPESAV